MKKELSWNEKYHNLWFPWFCNFTGIIRLFIPNQQKIKNGQLLKEAELKEALVKIETQNKLQEQRLQI